MTWHSRFQLSRKAGYRMPEGGKSVARCKGGKYGNPFVVDQQVDFNAYSNLDVVGGFSTRQRITSTEQAVRMFEAWWRLRIAADPTELHRLKADLAGHDLGCYCRLQESYDDRVWCHADVLLRFANYPDMPPETGAAIWIDPARRGGRPCLSGTSLYGEHVAHGLVHEDVAGYKDTYGVEFVPDRDVLAACAHWVLFQRDRHENKADRDLRNRWLGWATVEWEAMWHTDHQPTEPPR